MYNQNVGRFGEKLARDYLMKRGYSIIGANVKTSYKEIDIVSLKDNVLVFAEVKTRTSEKFGGAEESIFSNKTNHLKKAIGLYLREHRKALKYQDIRLDLIAIDICKDEKLAKIKHYKDIA
jgi:putative endonuclease